MTRRSVQVVSLLHADPHEQQSYFHSPSLWSFLIVEAAPCATLARGLGGSSPSLFTYGAVTHRSLLFDVVVVVVEVTPEAAALRRLTGSRSQRSAGASPPPFSFNLPRIISDINGARQKPSFSPAPPTLQSRTSQLPSCDQTGVSAALNPQEHEAFMRTRCLVR